MPASICIYPSRRRAHFYRSLGIVVPAYVIASDAYDEGDDRTLDEITHYEVDAAGRTIAMHRDISADGVIEQQSVMAYSRNTQTTTYDARGYLASSRSETATGADGSVDQMSRHTYIYDDAGRLTMAASDLLILTMPSTIDTFAAPYGIDGFATTEISTYDSDANGAYNQRFVSTYTRDAQGRILTRLSEGDAGGAVQTRTLQTATDDANGNELTLITEADTDANGVLDSRRGNTTTYDGAGNELTWVSA
jgi:hypothetical protein